MRTDPATANQGRRWSHHDASETCLLDPEFMRGKYCVRAKQAALCALQKSWKRGDDLVGTGVVGLIIVFFKKNKKTACTTSIGM